MVTFEFEFYTPESQYPAIVLMDLRSSTEAENFAYQWLKKAKADTYKQLRSSMTRSEKREILSIIPLFHVNISRPIERSSDGSINIRRR